MDCPSREELENVMRGTLSFADVERVATHVEKCGLCETTLLDLKSDDTLAPLLRTPPQGAASAAAVRRLRERLCKKEGAAETMSMQEAVDGGLSPNFLAPAQENDEIGRLGTYRVLQVLGAGGMGMVFLAHDPKLDRNVALKVMLPKFAANEAAKQRFLREARTAANLHNDHIVTIHQVGEESGIPFLAMELLHGASLEQYAKGRTIAIKAVLRIGREISKGLAAAHARGLIHRDIKPANIWIDTTARRVKLLDFGLARNEKDNNQITRSGAIVGTPAFMSPEQARGDRAVDARSDLFSLGCVLYRLAVGDIPFKSETTMGVLLAIAMNTPAAPSEVDARVPPALSDLIMRLLSKDPDDRPASAAEVIAQIEQMEHTPGGGTRSTPRAVANKKQPGARRPAKTTAARRWPIVAAALVGVAALGVVLALGAYILRLETAHGTLVVEVNDKDVETRFKNGKLILLDADGKARYTISPNEPKTKIDDGRYTIHIMGADGLAVDVKEFTMKRQDNDQVRVRVTLDPAIAAVTNAPAKLPITSKANDPPTSKVPLGPAERHLRFDGTSAHVLLPTLKLTAQQPVTFEMRVKFDGSNRPATSTETIIGRLTPESGLLIARTGGSGLIFLSRRNLKVKFNGLGSTVEDGEWRHVAAVWDGAEGRLFLDGKIVGRSLDNAIPQQMADLQNQPTLILGGEAMVAGLPTSNFFGGLMDEIRISKIARYKADYTPKDRLEADDDTLALFHCDEGGGDQLVDSSSNKNHGKIIGVRWVDAAAHPKTPAKTSYQGPATPILRPANDAHLRRNS